MYWNLIDLSVNYINSIGMNHSARLKIDVLILLHVVAAAV